MWLRLHVLSHECTEGDSAGCWIHFNDLYLQDVISVVTKTAGLTVLADAACFSILLQRGPTDGFPSLTAASGKEEAPEPLSQMGTDSLTQHPVWMDKTPGFKAV